MKYINTNGLSNTTVSHTYIKVVVMTKYELVLRVVCMVFLAIPLSILHTAHVCIAERMALAAYGSVRYAALVFNTGRHGEQVACWAITELGKSC